MKSSFEQNRPLIENEFENASFDPSTGKSAEVLYEELLALQNSESDKSRPILCSEAYAYLLDQVQLEINEHTPFSVKLNLGVDYTYFAKLDIFDEALYRNQLFKILAEHFPEEHQKASDRKESGTSYPRTDFWHTVPNWPYLIEHGFSGILQNAKDSKARLLQSGSYTEEQIDFLDSVILRYEAILRLLTRIYEYSLRFDMPEFSACIKQLSVAPPSTLYEVLQFSVLYLYFEEIGPERARSLGPIDQLYRPFVEQMLAEGKSIDEVKELFRYFFIHFTATKRFAQQPFTLCGSDEHGNDRTNFLTHLLLEVYDELNIYDPKIHIRYHKNLDPTILTKTLSMIRRGNSSLCIINDEAVYRGYEKIGIPRSDAQHYVLLGCYEPIIMGMEEAEIGGYWFNLVKCVEMALHGGRDLLTGKQIGSSTPLEADSFDEFLSQFFLHLDESLDFELDYLRKQSALNTLIHPSPIYSSSFPECIEHGRDVHEYPLKYNNLSLKIFGLATVVDSLTAIKKFVFDQKTTTLDELRTAISANWEGYEELRQTILGDRDKYGNNLQLPDEIMTKITEHLAERYRGRKLARGGSLRIGLDSINWCLIQAKRTAATPDGRRVGDPISKNLCATNGMDRGGITAYMQSVLKIDAADFFNSAVLDFMLHPSAVEGEKGLADFGSLIKIFFAHGGFAVQGNIIQGDTLRDAQAHPEKYPTLQIRVCGWNEYFTKLSKKMQDNFIAQSEVMGR